jgi:hypothetical protein
MYALYRALFAVLLLLPGTSVLAQQGTVTGATVTWYGEYQVRSTTETKDAKAVTGSYFTSTLVGRPTTNNDQIAIEPDVRFGFGYRLLGSPGSAVVDIKHVRRFPPEGIFNPSTGQRVYFEERDLQFAIDRDDLYVGYYLGDDPEHPSNIPGVWTFEVWHNNRKLIDKSFTLYRPRR